MLRGVQLQPEEVKSFEVKFLSTNVPIGEALEVILQRLKDDTTLLDRTPLPPERITQLLELCLRTPTSPFAMNSSNSRMDQQWGPWSHLPVVANIYMEMFEEQALKLADDTHPYQTRAKRDDAS